MVTIISLSHSPLSPMPRLWLVFNRALRLQPVLRRCTPRNHFPITPQILGQYGCLTRIRLMGLCCGQQLQCTTGFFGFLRSQHHPHLVMTRRATSAGVTYNVAIDNPESPSCVRVHLRHSVRPLQSRCRRLRRAN